MSNLIPYDDLTRMAAAIYKSGMFGLKTPEAATGLFLLAQAEGVHPMMGLRRYHILSDGRASMRSDAMLADFRTKAGGRVKWIRCDHEEARAIFTVDGNSLEISYNISEARAAGYIRAGSGWTKDPGAMLRARLISRGVRMMAPEVVTGMYTPEEVADFEPQPQSAPIALSPAPSREAVAPILATPITAGTPAATVDLRTLEDLLGHGQTVAFEYLLSIGWLVEGQSFCDLKPAHDKRIRANVADFLKAAVAAFPKDAPAPVTNPSPTLAATGAKRSAVIGTVQ